MKLHLPLILLALAACKEEPTEETYLHTYDVAVDLPFSAVDVDLSGGNITIQATDAEWGCRGDLESGCDISKFACEVIDDILIVRPTCGGGNCLDKTNIRINVPAQVAANVVSTDSDVRVRSLVGMVDVQVENGDVSLERLLGPADARVVGAGEITGSRLQSLLLSASAAEGDIELELERRPWRLEVEVADGEALIELPEGPYQIDDSGLGTPAQLVGVTDDPERPDVVVLSGADGSASVAGSTYLKSAIEEAGNYVLEAEAGTFYENGVGAPALAYDDATSQWNLFFETKLEDTTGGPCGEIGKWGIGRAVSDGDGGFIVDPEPLIGPEDGTWHACVTAQPTVVHEPDGWHMWFKAEQTYTACDGTTPPWGCGKIIGIGHMFSPDGENWTVTDGPVLSMDYLGFPSVVKVDDTYIMMLQHAADAQNGYTLWRAESSDGVTWTQPMPAIRENNQDWDRDELFNPAVTCATDHAEPYILWNGGRLLADPANPFSDITEASIGTARSVTGETWSWDFDNPYLTWETAELDQGTDWRHWDVLRTDDDYLFSFSRIGEDGKSAIGMASITDLRTAKLENTVVGYNKVCRNGILETVPDIPPETLPCED